MELRSSNRSSRSRSKTPFSMSTVEQEILKSNHIEESISKSTRRVVTTSVRTSNGSNVVDSVSEEYNNKYVKPSSSRRFTRAAQFHKTSDYSSEEGENEVSSTRSISENERNRILEDARKVADNSSGITALGLYRRAKRYWDEYPKTDWTYSPFSKDRVEIAPGVVAMPNMSRRHISSYDKYTNTEESSFYSSKLKPQKLFSSRSEETTVLSITRKIFVSVVMFFVSIVYVLLNSTSYVYKSTHYASLKLAKVIHRVTSRIMLLDTWLLRKRRNASKTTSLLALCLVPLLLIAGWWTFSKVGSDIYGSFFDSSGSLLRQSSAESDQSKPNHDQPSFNAAGSVSSLTDEQLQKIAQYVKLNLNVNEHINNDELIDKLLNTESIKKVVDNYNVHSQIDSELEEKYQQQAIVIEELTNELKKMKIDLINIRNREIDVNQLKTEIRNENMRKIDHLVFSLNKCCRKSVNLESHILKSLSAYLNNPDFLQRQEGLKNWLNSLFVAKTELEGTLSNLTESLNSKFDETLESNSKFLMDQVTARLHLELNNKYRTVDVVQGRAEGDAGLTEERIREIVKDTLKIYDADKTGLVDYAMEPMGGQVITTRCTETYNAGTAVVSVLGIPLWYPASSPRSAITPGISPGKCWAFQNFPGLLVIKLIAPVKIEAFSLEHISKLLVSDGKIDSAPKNFEVYGLQSEVDRNGVKLGEYKYDYDGDSLQFFITHKPDQVVEYIELRITSNHGNPNYTCLYRFRVHGKIQAKSS